MGPVSDDNGLNEEERGAVVASLHRVLKPFLLRRIKSDVIADLPDKVQQYDTFIDSDYYSAYIHKVRCIQTVTRSNPIESNKSYQVERTITCQLSGLQTFLYQNFRTMSQLNETKCVEAKINILYCDDKDGDRERQRERDSLTGKEGSTSGTSYRNYNGDTVTNTFSHSCSGRLSYSNVLMQLRKLCNHPYLLLEDVKTIPDELYYKDLVASSGKLSLLHGLLKNLIPKGHKVSDAIPF